MAVELTDRQKIVKTWFIVLGVVLLLLAVLGTLGIDHPLGGSDPIGTDVGEVGADPGAAEEVTGPLHLGDGEMWLHWILGIATLGIAFLVKDGRTLVMIAYTFGVVYVLVGLFGFLVPRVGVWHVGTVDNILHLVIGGVNFAVGYAASERAIEPARVAR